MNVHCLNNITGASALTLLRHQVPDLPDDTMEMLVILSEQVPYTLCLIAQGLRSGLVDSVEILNALQGRLRTFDDAVEEKFRLSEEDYDMTQKMLSIVKTTLDYIPDSHKELLCEMAEFDSPVQLSTAKEILNDAEVNTLCSLLNEAPNFPFSFFSLAMATLQKRASVPPFEKPWICPCFWSEEKIKISQLKKVPHFHFRTSHLTKSELSPSA